MTGDIKLVIAMCICMAVMLVFSFVTAMWRAEMDLRDFDRMIEDVRKDINTEMDD